MKAQSQPSPRPDPLARQLGVFTLLLAGLLLLVSISHRETAAPPPPLEINANTAPAAVLSTLPFMGATRVNAVVAEREKRPFRSLEDLAARVRGIGPATQAALRPYLQFGDPPLPSVQPR
jgi:competence protein ComEA